MPFVEIDIRENELQQREKAKLFFTFRERWRSMLESPDFRATPSDVQDYWRTFPPDSGFGTNAKFLGLGRVVAIDY